MVSAFGAMSMSGHAGDHARGLATQNRAARLRVFEPAPLQIRSSAGKLAMIARCVARTWNDRPLPQLLSYPRHLVPAQWACQIRSFVRVQWPALHADAKAMWFDAAAS